MPERSWHHTCLYTDHQIFDRYQRYRINGEIRRDEQMTVAELNQLRPGDYPKSARKAVA